MAEKSRGNTTDFNDAARLVSLMWKNRRFLVSSGRRAMYIGCVGNKNFGDDLIRVAIHDIFRDVCTFYSQPYHSVQQSDRLFFQVFVRNVEMPMVFLGGGTLIKSHGKSIYLSRIRQAQNRNSNTRLVVFGPGVEDIELAEKKGHKINTTPWVETLNQAEYIGVRGPLSKHALESWGVTQPVHITADPGIYYAPDALTPHPLGKRIGINLAGG
ncbi:MAG: polysaccharide pyruvyl transferase family protein [Chloroflexi bacterium]|nr:polysaccharide pyruvyl transferase family protein [Chloroflexota bacterium]